MGFSSFLNKAKEVGKKILNGVKEGGKKIAKKVGRKLEEWGKGIGRLMGEATDESAKKIGSKEKYNRSHVQNVESTTLQITAFVQQIEIVTNQIEDMCLEECRSYYYDIIRMLETSDTDIDLSILNDYLDKGQRRIKGFLKKYIKKKISIDNPECVRILKLVPGANKTNRMKKFQDMIINKGLELLCEKVDEIVNNQNRYIHDYFDNIAQTIENKYQTMIEDCKKFENISNSNSDLKKQEILNHSLIISFCDNILSEFND